MMRKHHFISRHLGVHGDGSFNTSALVDKHLLVYESDFSEGLLSQDIRDLLQDFPMADSIAVLAPSVLDGKVLEVTTAVAALRAGSPAAPNLVSLSFSSTEKIIQQTDVVSGLVNNLESSTQRGWISDLFHRSRCLVHAPDGIHFGKTSGKHSQTFIRAANALTSTLECSMLAFFALPLAAPKPSSRIYVDTGPLVSVAWSCMEQCVQRGVWLGKGAIDSFSSYDGIERLRNAPPDHLAFISASTSGGLASEVSLRTHSPERIITFFYIQGEGQPTYVGPIVADLTAGSLDAVGYEPIKTYKHDECDWCRAGVPYASFEGDQFHLQKRKVEVLNIAYHPNSEERCSMKPGAKHFFEATKSTQSIQVRTTATGSGAYCDIVIHAEVLKRSSGIRKLFAESLVSAVAPDPLDIYVSDGISSDELIQFPPYAASKNVVPEKTASSVLQAREVKHGAQVLVAFPFIQSMHVPRKINEILRAVAPDGNIAYASAVTFVESPEQYKQLCSALRSGSKGSNTFKFSSGPGVLLRPRHEPLSSWEMERGLLEQACETVGSAVPVEIASRLEWIQNAGLESNGIFWPAQNGQLLKLQNDFVFLTVDGSESQADVYAIVSNLLTCATHLNRNPEAEFNSSLIRRALENSVYAEVLFEPNNFMKFNDAILRAAFLRAATPSELSYVNDLAHSKVVQELIIFEVSEWMVSRGAVLPEFLVALGSKRLRLCAEHTAAIRQVVSASAFLPPYIKVLASFI